MTVSEKLVKIAENEQKVFDAGKDAEYNAFWDAYQDYGKRGNYASAFFQAWWNDTTYRPKYEMNLTTVCSSMFQASNITNTKVRISIGDFESCNNIFYNCRELKTIPYLKLSEKNNLSQAFRNCINLKTIYFDGVIGKDLDLQWSKQLARTSIESLINHLKKSDIKRVQSDDEYFAIYCNISGGNLTAFISPATYHYEDLKVEEAHWYLYNAETNELIDEQWVASGNEAVFIGLDDSITYRIEVTELFGTTYDIDGNPMNQDSITATYVTYTDTTLLEPIGTITLSLEAVNREFGEYDLDIWIDGSSSNSWWNLCEQAPDWTISLV